MGLSVDPPAPDIMRRPPVRHGIFTRELVADFCFYGLVMGAMTLGSFTLVVWGVNDGDLGVDCNTTDGVGCALVEEARGTAFVVLNALLLIHAYNCRHMRQSAFSMPLFENRVLLGSVIGGFLITLPLLYTPWLSTTVFKHSGLTWEWGLCLGLPIAFVLLSELYKFGKRRVLSEIVAEVDEVFAGAGGSPAASAPKGAAALPARPAAGGGGGGVAGEIEMGPLTEI